MRPKIQPDTIAVQMTLDELRDVCYRLCGDLVGEMVGGGGCANDMDEILMRWRKYSPHFVRHASGADERWKKFGRGSNPFPRFNEEQAEAERAALDETADFLERLLRYIPEDEEVAGV